MIRQTLSWSDLPPGLPQRLSDGDLVVPHRAHRLALILGFALYTGTRFAGEGSVKQSPPWLGWISYALLIPAGYALFQVWRMIQMIAGGAMRIDPAIEAWHYGYPLLFATSAAILLSWTYRQVRERLSPPDLVLMVCAMGVAGYLILIFGTPLRASTGTSLAPIGISYAALAGSLLILELPRRVAGMALVVISAILYFLSVYCMVDFEAARKGMRKDEIPLFSKLVKQVYLFAPIVILIAALFMGYSVIRAGTLATAAAAVVSWISPNKMGIREILKALQLAGTMSIQIIAVCACAPVRLCACAPVRLCACAPGACAGIIVGVISLTCVGARFSSLLLGLAGVSQLLALIFAMLISILLGMGMPTTAAYAVAASVVVPGLINIGIQPLVAHFFVFYFAVVSAITPPVALASYAAAGISGDNAMGTSVASFKIGLAAFIVPFMFFYSPAMLMEGSTMQIIRVAITASLGIILLAGAVQAWFFGPVKNWQRLAMFVAGRSQ